MPMLELMLLTAGVVAIAALLRWSGLL